MDLCHTRGQAKGTGLKKPGRGTGWPSCGKTSTPMNVRYCSTTMTEPITKFDDAVELYFESGSARLRLKEGVSCKSMLDKKNQSPMLLNKRELLTIFIPL